MVFLTKQEKREYVYEQSVVDGNILDGNFRCPVCGKYFSVEEKACCCCTDFDDEGLTWQNT